MASVDWTQLETSVVAAVAAVFQQNAVPAAQEAARGALFLAQTEKLLQENASTMSDNTKKLLAEQQKLAFNAYVNGYKGVNTLLAAKAVDAVLKELASALGSTPFLA